VAAFRSLLALLRGPCVACGAPRSSPLCEACLEESFVGPRVHCDQLEDGHVFLFAGAYHARPGIGLSPLGRALRAFKDRGDRLAGRALARLLAARCTQDLLFADAVVAVPSDASHTRARGFAPASWLARAVSRTSGLPLISGLVLRKPGHPPQRGLDGADRRLNASRAFELGPSRVPGYTLLLVDDVVTTGATLGRVASLLREAGASEVLACVVACADEDVIARCRSRTESAGRRSTSARLR
jgi:ComF family protein